ncbi:uncharacterized protein LOC130510167 isoform X1 [Raphanus sativus]|uniref:Uncharacterized protein LOC130510167 isoform X1 n=1 Tax=Raphanus sativus TaxID=3726 RepID=A0A9W3DFC8_RAPSA|nr:uncharacterized protein LOC130510167 isoform X1 [Raphanus sativus]
MVTEYLRPPKKRRLDIASGESRSSATRPNLQSFNSRDDECIRQYISYYYQFQKSEGFEIGWDKLDYLFDTMPMIDPYRASEYKTNDEIIREGTCLAIARHNSDKGTRLVFLDHVSASYRCCAGVLYYVTFWAMDLASSSPVPKLYQSNFRRCGPTFCEVYLFRLKPTDQEIAAVQVDPPPPLNEDIPERPTVLFTVTGPGSGFIPNVVFTRIPAQVSVSLPESSSPSLLVT